MQSTLTSSDAKYAGPHRLADAPLVSLTVSSLGGRRCSIFSRCKRIYLGKAIWAIRFTERSGYTYPTQRQRANPDWTSGGPESLIGRTARNDMLTIILTHNRGECELQLTC